MKVNILATGSTGNAIVINDGKTQLLLDCGIPYEKIIAKVGTVDAILISHSHADHSRGIDKAIKAGKYIFMPPKTSNDLKALFERYRGKPKTIEFEKAFQVKTFNIVPLKLIHDAECAGWLIGSVHTKEKLLFATDTSCVPYKFTGLTHVIMECNYIEANLDHNIKDGTTNDELAKRIWKTHMSLETCVRFFEAQDLSKLQEVYLIHGSKNNCDMLQCVEVVQGVVGSGVKVIGG